MTNGIPIIGQQSRQDQKTVKALCSQFVILEQRVTELTALTRELFLREMERNTPAVSIQSRAITYRRRSCRKRGCRC